jgi:hypothetical protein
MINLLLERPIVPKAAFQWFLLVIHKDLASNLGLKTVYPD